ncbi:ABC transporter ATP-binding protein [Peptoniphilus indolicus]|uniref:ABC-type quaternary amine transporter n=2 Tax=Peptoniphilus indolicus TaxID=33030 RepID=G4D2X9_9FIRM|nr:ABC transporter ATP-binding protein [Peptoniphilus indolicus]EGY80113.1 spermidine/putrescine ABC superfamily ATP binding cassette transporter, ABC protein [Peptoniphilus indolicus ATCC 29427]SUB75156.1 Spermidine/putrescine import ATP-binding protein PotA [Peptoniphilus indolicus]
MSKENLVKLELVGIQKSYGKKIVINNLGLKVYDGERISLLGPSGCGKSTLLNTIVGLIDFEGIIFLDGIDITNKAANKRNIVMVSQENHLFPHMNVYENIAFPMRVRKLENSEIQNRVRELLNDINLNGYETKKVNQLSGGEKQRIALARALAATPEVLLLDEAYSSLDTNMRFKMRELTVELQKKHNITTILVTHDKEEAMMFSDRIGVMLNGEIEQLDFPKKIYESPKSLDVAKFLISENFITTDQAMANGLIEEELDTNKVVLIKPEDICIKTDLKNGIVAKILDKKYSMAKIKYELLINGMELIVDDYRKNDLEIGSEVGMEIKNYIVF